MNRNESKNDDKSGLSAKYIYNFGAKLFAIEALL
jgi:hypothetical protein